LWVFLLSAQFRYHGFMPSKDFPEQVNRLINEHGATVEGASVCSSWILIAEWVDGDGHTWLEEHRTYEMPPWKRQGILTYVLNEPVIEYETDEDD